MKARGLKPAGLFLFSPAFAHQHRDPVVRKLPLARMARAKTVEQCRRHGRVVYRGELRMVVALEDQHIEVTLRENSLVILGARIRCISATAPAKPEMCSNAELDTMRSKS